MKSRQKNDNADARGRSKVRSLHVQTGCRHVSRQVKGSGAGAWGHGETQLCDVGAALLAERTGMTPCSRPASRVKDRVVKTRSHGLDSKQQAQRKPVCSPARCLEGAKSGSWNQVAFFHFPGGLRCVCRSAKTSREVMEHEWSLLPDVYVLLVNGRRVSPEATLRSVAPGLPVRVLFRLSGGAAAAHKKLRELLIVKGVAGAEVQPRIQEVVTAIGDPGIQECFSGFAPWQSLKNKCQSKVRLVKASEQRTPKHKRQTEDVDPLQERDPWSEAIQSRQLKPDPNFFVTRAGVPPTVLQAVTHGTSGIVVVDAREAAMWAKSPEDICHD